MKRPLPLVIAVAVLAVSAAYWYFALRAPAPVEAPEESARVPAAPAAPEPTVVAPAGPAAPLPGLDESDAAIDEWLFGLVGREVVERFMVREGMARKIVATVDNLPRKKVDLRVRAIRPLPGAFTFERDGEEMQLGPSSWSRYDALAASVVAIDPGRAADLYVRVYPLLQQSYEELGDPGHQFHARALEAIDDLLAAPVPETPPRLVQPHVLYEFADPGLESRSAGQKIMLRIGPAHATLVREWLKGFRREIVARSTAPAG